MWAFIGLVGRWFGKYLYFSKATICICGLVFSHSFVNHAVVNILITYLTYNWSHPQFQIAAVIVNVANGKADIMAIFLAHISHTYKKGGFKIIVTTNAAYILGLLLFWLSAAYMSMDTAARVFYGAVVLIILGEAGRWAALGEFLDRQYLRELKQTREGTDEKQLDTRGKALWRHPWFLGAVLPPFLIHTTWEQILMISTIVMGVSYLLFWFGFSYYFINNKNSEEEISKDGEVNLVENEGRAPLWTLIKNMKEKKHFLKEILAMWLVFLIYSLVMGAGDTFFYEQMSNLYNPFRNYNPAVHFNVLSKFSKYMISFLCKLIPKQWKSRATRMRFGSGMVCTFLCCLVAWQVEIRRMKKVNTSESMSIFWFIPQFFLLGFMEGLAREGWVDFFFDRVDDDDKVMVRYYGYHICGFIEGIGRLLTAFSILAFRRRWFDDNINRSRLDKYYRALTFISLAIFCYYLWVAIYFYSKDESQKSAEDERDHSRNRSDRRNCASEDGSEPLIWSGP